MLNTIKTMTQDRKYFTLWIHNHANTDNATITDATWHMTASQSNHSSSRSSSNSVRTGCHKETDVNARTICTTSCVMMDCVTNAKHGVVYQSVVWKTYVTRATKVKTSPIMIKNNWHETISFYKIRQKTDDARSTYKQWQNLYNSYIHITHTTVYCIVLMLLQTD